ncbi:hypothetical protein [Lonepinella sp. BR2474]|uniref:hypothetical protein n=1 Tax=Lonepinella sp. BR2474 TaxID=3434548 RepID=UPI003F6DBA73
MIKSISRIFTFLLLTMLVSNMANAGIVTKAVGAYIIYKIVTKDKKDDKSQSELKSAQSSSEVEEEDCEEDDCAEESEE